MRLVLALLAAAIIAGGSARAGGPQADWGLARTPPAAATRPWIGVVVTEVEVEGDDEPHAPGITIARVAAGSPAARAGLGAGDVILAADGHVLDDCADLLAAMKRHAPGEAFDLVVVRGPRVERLSLTLASAPDATASETRRVLPLPATVEARPGQLPYVPARPPGGVALTYAGLDARGSLGIETMDLGAGLARYFGTREGEGVLVEKVHPGSPAASAGLSAGDVVLAISGQPVTSGAALTELLRAVGPGERVTASLLRDGRHLDITAVLERSEVPVWVVETPAAAPTRAPTVPGSAEGDAVELLVDHQRREARRLEVLLEALEEGDEDLVLVLQQGRPDAKAARKTRVAELRGDLARLQGQVKEMEQSLAMRAPAPMPLSSGSPRPAP
jgi:membrane-associated protease RseP (regulator of RpoE activity)